MAEPLNSSPFQNGTVIPLARHSAPMAVNPVNAFHIAFCSIYLCCYIYIFLWHVNTPPYLLTCVWFSCGPSRPVVPHRNTDWGVHPTTAKSGEVCPPYVSPASLSLKRKDDKKHWHRDLDSRCRTHQGRSLLSPNLPVPFI